MEEIKAKLTGRLTAKGLENNGNQMISEVAQNASIKFQNPGMALAAINSIDSVIQIASDVNVVLDQVMDAVLKVFNASRAWLFHPCNPKLPSFDVTFESTTSEYPGANASMQQVPMTDDMAHYCRRALAAIGGPEIDPPEGQPVTNDIAVRFRVKSMLFMALRPKSGEPWMFGLHQCDRERVWSCDEKQLFHMIGQRITSCIDNFLHVRKLREREALLNHSQQISSIGSFVWDLKTDGLQWSKNMYRIHGIQENAFEGNLAETFQKLIHPDDRDLVRSEINRMIEAGRVWNMEFRIRRSDGVERFMRFSGEFTLDKNGKPLKCIGVHQDITDQKRSESALKESEFRFRSFVENANDIVYALSPDGLFTYVSPNWLEFMGEPADDAIGNSFIPYVHSDDVHLCQQILYKVLKSGQKQSSVEYRIKHPDGSLRWHVSNGSPMKDKEGNITGYVGIARDVTEKKQSEKAILESEERYRKLVNTAPYGIQLTDRNGKIIFSNPAHHKIQGYENGQLIGKYIWELMADDQYRLKAKSFYQKLIKEQPRPEVYFNRDFTRDGREIDVQINWDYIRNPEGEVEGIISIISDITKQKALESSLRQAQRMESIGNLAGGIAHDFNNILFPIIGLSEILLEDLPHGSQERENAEEIYKAGKRGSDLVKQILAFSRQSEHKMMPTRIQNILKEVSKLSRSTIPSFIEIKQDIQEHCGIVLADPSQIHRIVMNIITNAYHAVESTGGQISIALKQTTLEDPELIEINLAPGAYAVLSVSDTGHGMSEEIIGKIFDPYFTTKAQGKGTGLGLAVVYGIVKEHGGAINVYSEIGKGSTFDIYLPLMKKLNGVESIHDAQAYPAGNERILVVDDEVSIARLEKQMLERLGYQVTSRINSVEAVEAFRADPSAFDLVVTDMSMPNIPGDELARKIKSIRSDVPVIICTGFSERLNPEKAACIGINGFLMKPIVKAEMAKMVRKVLDEAKTKSCSEFD